MKKLIYAQAVSAHTHTHTHTHTHYKKCGNNTIYFKIFSALIVLTLIHSSMKAQNLLWQQTYLAGNETHGYSIKQTFDGGFIVGGSATLNDTTKDIFVIRTDANGDTIWTKQIGGAANDEAFCIEQTSDSGFVVAGYTNSYGNGSSDFFLVKLNGSGAIQWTRTNGGALADGSYSVIATKDGGYLVTGYTSSSGAGGRDVQVYKFNSGGNTQWNKTVGGALEDVGYSATQLFDSTYIIAGSSKSFSGNGNVDVYVIKLKTNGDTLWTKTYPNTGTDIAYAVYACKESGFVITGKTNSKSNNDYDALWMRVYDDGQLVLRKTIGNASDDCGLDIKETKNFTYTIGGYTTIDGDTNAYVATVNDRGELIEGTYFGSTGRDAIYSVCITEENEIAACGDNYDSYNSTFVLGIFLLEHCQVGYPRGLWCMDTWRFNADRSNDYTLGNLLVDDKWPNSANNSNKTWVQKVEDFIDYCNGASIHTVVLGHSEDIIREIGIDVYSLSFDDYPSNNPVSGSVLNDRLRTLIYRLHTEAAVYSVLCQWLDQTPGIYNWNNCTYCNSNYMADEDIQPDNNVGTSTPHQEEILEAFKTLNNPYLNSTLHFDGLVMDYESTKEDFGGGSNRQYFLQGFKYNWLPLAQKFIDCRDLYQATSGVKIVETWLYQMVLNYNNGDNCVYSFYTDVNNADFFVGNFNYDQNSFWDANAPAINGNVTAGANIGTSEADFRLAISDIDDLHFDAIILKSSPKDEMDKTVGANFPDKDPSQFLTGDGYKNPTNNKLFYSDAQLMRYCLELFGHDYNNVKTNVIPYFMVRNHHYEVSTNTFTDCITVDEENFSYVGDLMLQGCNWTNLSWPTQTNVVTPFTGPHFLHEIEEDYLAQFIMQLGIQNGDFVDPEITNPYGNVNLNWGFHWYQYSFNNDYLGTNFDIKDLYVLSNHALANRADDKWHATWDPCAQNRGMNNFIPPASKTKKMIKIESDLVVANSISPNPFTNSALILFANDVSISSIEVIDVFGRNVTEHFNFKLLNPNAFIIENNSASQGIYYLINRKEIGNNASIKFTVTH